MPTTKLRAPDSFGGLSIEGRLVEVGKDGAFHADARDVTALRSHGFTDWHDQPGAGGDIETMTKTQLVDAIVMHTRGEAEKRGEDELRSALRQVRGVPLDADDLPPTAADIAEAAARLKAEQHVTEERIEVMTRPELFAYLRASAVAIGPATKDPGLRAAALDHFRKSRATAG